MELLCGVVVLRLFAFFSTCFLLQFATIILCVSPIHSHSLHFHVFQPQETVGGSVCCFFFSCPNAFYSRARPYFTNMAGRWQMIVPTHKVGEKAKKASPISPFPSHLFTAFANANFPFSPSFTALLAKHKAYLLPFFVLYHFLLYSFAPIATLC